MGGCQTVLWIGTLARSDRTNLAPCFRVMLEKRRPVSDSKAKSIPWWAARLRMAHIWHNPPPPGTWHTVLICCTMYGTEQPKEQPQICDRGSNPVAINHFLIFLFLLGLHVLVLFFHLLIFFILCGLLHLI